MSARDLPLHFRERGTDDGSGRPTLVFLHYFGGSGRSWEPVMEIMARRAFRCIAPDLRGFGESVSAKNAERAFSVAQWSDDVLELARFLGLSRFALVGHSMGGKVALAVAARAPVGLKAVVLLAPSPPTPEPMPAKERARLLESYGDAAAAMETLRKITAGTLPKDRATAAVDDNLRTAPAAWRAWLKRGSHEDISAELAAVHVPVSIAVGAADETITAALVQREIVARLALSTTVRTIARAGHLLPLEAPKATADFTERSVWAGNNR